jgi:hypothetical protein
MRVVFHTSRKYSAAVTPRTFCTGLDVVSRFSNDMAMTVPKWGMDADQMRAASEVNDYLAENSARLESFKTAFEIFDRQLGVNHRR